MKEYRLNQAAFSYVKRQIALRLAILGPVAVGVGSFAAGVKLDSTLFILVPIIFICLYISYRRAVSKQHADWKTFVLQLSENAIVRKIDGYPEYVIDRQSFTKFDYLKSGDMVIAAGPKKLYISQHLEQIEEFKFQMEEWKNG